MEIKISLGSAAVLGLASAKTLAEPSTCYLLMAEKCGSDCGFCAQARSAKTDRKWLSRVSWPSFDLADLLQSNRPDELKAPFQRICIQSVLSSGWFGRLEELIWTLNQAADFAPIPISCSALPRNANELRSLFAAGLDRIGIPLDAATPWIFRAVKSGEFSRTYRLIREAAERYPGRISTHLIIGLGETEQEAATILQEFAACDVRVGLFAFTPVPGTRLANLPPPPLAQYRRIQVLGYLLAQQLPVDLTFSPEGKIIDFGYDHCELEGLLSAGSAFRTSGCPGCNRPYYNERPGQTPFNFPRPLTEIEIEAAFAELVR